MAIRRIHARRMTIKPVFFAMHEIDVHKVEALKVFILGGGIILPVVAVQYGKEFMPIDGHHRFSAARDLGRDLDAWVVPAARFERLDMACREARDFDRAEDYVMCGGVPALHVAPRKRD